MVVESVEDEDVDDVVDGEESGEVEEVGLGESGFDLVEACWCTDSTCDTSEKPTVMYCKHGGDDKKM